jgi:hypothetical protein
MRERRPLGFFDGMLYTGGVVLFSAFAHPRSFWWILLFAAAFYPVIWLSEQYVAPLGDRAGRAAADWLLRKLHAR